MMETEFCDQFHVDLSSCRRRKATDNNDYYMVTDKSYLQHDQYYNMEGIKTDFNEATVVVIYRMQSVAVVDHR